MIDLFLLFFVLVIIGVAIFANIHVLVYFQAPEDSNFATSLFCKIVIVSSLTLAWLVNMLLPIDVRNSRPKPGPLDMETIWVAMFTVLLAFLIIIVPCVMFYTEVEGDDAVKNKKRYICSNLFITLLFSGSALAISYPFLADAAIPMVGYSCDAWQDGDAVLSELELATKTCAVGKDMTLDIKVSLQVYAIGMLCFIGWFFVAIFGGIGLSAVPLDMITEFRDRPRPVNEQQYQQRKKLLGQASSQLVQVAEEMQTKESELAHVTGWALRRRQREVKTMYNKFKRDVTVLETEFEKLQVSKFYKGELLAVSIMKLFIGLCCGALSLLWVVHIVLCVVVPHLFPGSPRMHFLETLFSACEAAGLYPLSVALFAIFSLYLLVCVVKGCLKFGMRIFFFFSVHPMKHKATPLNSILFNVEMVLLTSAAVAQFTRKAFADYARLTQADVIFGAQVQYLSFYSFFFKHNIFVYALLKCFLVSLIYLLVKPRDKSELRIDSKAEKKLAKMIGTGSTPEMPSKQGSAGGA